MAFYRKQKKGEKWYPASVTMGRYDTDDVVEQLARISTVSKADTYAVLLGLGEVLGDMLEAGRSVKLAGLGTFYLVGRARGRGVSTPDEVSPLQFGELRVRFIPEYRRTQRNKVAGRTIVPKQVEWIELADDGAKEE